MYANTIWKITEVSQQADYATSFQLQGKQKKQDRRQRAFVSFCLFISFCYTVFFDFDQTTLKFRGKLLFENQDFTYHYLVLK